jgi:hypothetical protein
VGDIENTPCVGMLVHPRFPNAHAMQMHAQGGTQLFIYFSKVVRKTMTTGLKVRSNQDKDINTKNILVLQHV